MLIPEIHRRLPLVPQRRVGLQFLECRHVDKLRNTLSNGLFTHDSDDEMVLRGGKLVGFVGRLDRCDRHVHLGAGSQLIDIETGSRPNHTRFGASVTIRKADGIFRLPRQGVYRHFQRTLGNADFNHLRHMRIEAKGLGRLRIDHRGIVPRQPCHRIGQFLQPTAVGPASVVHFRIVAEDNFKFI